MKRLFYNEDTKRGSLVKVNVGRRYEAETELYRDYNEENDGIFWLMQKAIMVKAHYSNKDLIEKKIYENADTIENGDIVEITVISETEMKIIETKQYKAKVLGDYSDCCVFEEIK